MLPQFWVPNVVGQPTEVLVLAASGRLVFWIDFLQFLQDAGRKAIVDDVIGKKPKVPGLLWRLSWKLHPAQSKHFLIKVRWERSHPWLQFLCNERFQDASQRIFCAVALVASRFVNQGDYSNASKAAH